MRMFFNQIDNLSIDPWCNLLNLEQHGLISKTKQCKDTKGEAEVRGGSAEAVWSFLLQSGGEAINLRDQEAKWEAKKLN